jgi:hypothetical protein
MISNHHMAKELAKHGLILLSVSGSPFRRSVVIGNANGKTMSMLEDSIGLGLHLGAIQARLGN